MIQGSESIIRVGQSQSSVFVHFSRLEPQVLPRLGLITSNCPLNRFSIGVGVKKHVASKPENSKIHFSENTFPLYRRPSNTTPFPGKASKSSPLQWKGQSPTIPVTPKLGEL